MPSETERSYFRLARAASVHSQRFALSDYTIVPLSDEQIFDIGRDLDRLHVAEMIEAAAFAPCGEVAGGPSIGFPGVGISDIGGEEFKDALCGLVVGRKQGGEGDVGAGRRQDSGFADYD